MALCPKCVIEGVISGGSYLAMTDDVDAEAKLQFSFTFRPDADGEVDVDADGERSVSFSGTIPRETEWSNGTTVEGTLRGAFGVRNGVRVADATVETYERDGELALMVLAVRSEERVTFLANISPPGFGVDRSGFDGIVFLGWPADELEGTASSD